MKNKLRFRAKERGAIGESSEFEIEVETYGPIIVTESVRIIRDAIYDRFDHVSRPEIFTPMADAWLPIDLVDLVVGL